MDVDSEDLIRHWPAMVRASERVLGSLEDAEDCASEALLALLEAPPRELRCIEAWLVTVAKRRAMDRLRARARNQVRHARLCAVEQLTHEDPATAVADRDEARWLASVAAQTLTTGAMDALTEVAAGVSVPEAAARLGTTRRSVESHIARARIALRVALAATLSVLAATSGALRRLLPATAVPAAVLAAAVYMAAPEDRTPHGPWPPSEFVPSTNPTDTAPTPTVARRRGSGPTSSQRAGRPGVAVTPPLVAQRPSSPPASIASDPLATPPKAAVTSAVGTTEVTGEDRDRPHDPVESALDCLSEVRVDLERVGC